MADVLIVGGGSAGCVLAARLSEDPACNVLLIEAGPDAPTAADLPADIADGSAVTVDHDWGYVSEPDGPGRSLPLPRARFMGGCSSTNACAALRGSPADYDRWAQLGNEGWGFADVLPFFRKLESDVDFHENEWHGTTGPLPIRRCTVPELNPVHRAFVEAARSVGLAHVEDHNRPGSVGVGLLPRTDRDGLRMSTARTYLAAARPRPNLTIRSDTLVDRAVLRAGRATGVRLATGELVDAERVVVAAGAYASPAILQRSGIGPARALAELGIDLAADLPGVGENLIDHPLYDVGFGTRVEAVGIRFQAIATLRSSMASPDGAPDLHVLPTGPFEISTELSPTGRGFGLVVGLVQPRSRGRVQLRSIDPGDAPRIDPAHLREPDDLVRMVEGTVVARRISRTAPLAELVAGEERTAGRWVSDDDRDALASSIRANVATYHHPVGTCRMGTDPRTGAVVNARGRVYGVDRLYVADASIMPTIPSVNTNLPTIMLAERIAAWLVDS
ncbi:MAG: GMC family oxidoreductase N-terminal domain-containing protein [Chloroflexi bacterium]|nr:GMC family oxidoreductase N-terminal domain-containing protein [Chloroflexota bacterium]